MLAQNNAISRNFTKFRDSWDRNDSAAAQLTGPVCCTRKFAWSELIEIFRASCSYIFIIEVTRLTDVWIPPVVNKILFACGYVSNELCQSDIRRTKRQKSFAPIVLVRLCARRENYFCILLPFYRVIFHTLIIPLAFKDSRLLDFCAFLCIFVKNKYLYYSYQIFLFFYVTCLKSEMLAEFLFNIRPDYTHIHM